MYQLFVTVLWLQSLGIIQEVLTKETSVVDRGDHVLVCSQEPMEFGILLDSSVSIGEKDFDKAKEFLVRFLQQFDIGGGENDVRVSIITFGKGIYPQDAFNLDTYTDKSELLTAIEKIPHRAGPRTDTGLAIRYMHDHQLTKEVVRSQAEKISLVITDGNSQSWRTTEKEANKARADNITMFALGVGPEDRVGIKELIRIAGSIDHVTRVNNFDSLDSIREILAKKTCVKKEKPTTPAPMHTESCGEANPADITFYFSPVDMGIDATTWTTNFISNVIDGEDMDVGFRYATVTGSCPLDEGFDLDTFEFVDDIHERLSYYDRMRLPSLVNMDPFEASRGGRHYARDVAVIFVGGGKKGGSELEDKVKDLLDNGVEVFVANPAGYPYRIHDAVSLSGRSSRQQSETFIDMLCSQDE